MKPDATLVATLSRWLDATDIDRLELSGPGCALSFSRTGAPPAMPEAPRPAVDTVDIRAPSLGVFLDRPPLATRPFAELGEVVAAGEPLACLQVGALLLPVRAPRTGIVAARLAEPGALVGYGAPLFRLQPPLPGDSP